MVCCGEGILPRWIDEESNEKRARANSNLGYG